MLISLFLQKQDLVLVVLSCKMVTLIPAMDQGLMVPGYPYCHNIHGVEITVIKLASPQDWTIVGIYRSPNVPLRQLCEAITEVYYTTFHRTTISLLEALYIGLLKQTEDLCIIY